MKLTRICPACDVAVEYEEFGGTLPCPQCGVLLDPIHDCNDGWDCDDYLLEHQKEKLAQ